jgi:hypothetical protein
MAKCSYCGKEKTNDMMLQINDKFFCDNVCRHSFDNNGGKAKHGAFPAEVKTESKSKKNSKITATAVGAVTAAIIAAVTGHFTTGFMQKDFAGLKEFIAPNKSFTIMLPKNVKEQKQTINTKLGPIDVISYTATAKHHDFTVAFSEYPASFIAGSNPQTILDGSRDGAVRNIQGQLLTETLFDIKGHPGRELKIEGPQKMILHVRVYLVGNKLYQVMAISKPAFAYDKKIDEVFDSFKIKGI